MIRQRKPQETYCLEYESKPIKTFLEYSSKPFYIVLKKFNTFIRLTCLCKNIDSSALAFLLIAF